MSKYFEIRWHGRGGQGTAKGANLLAEAVRRVGKYASGFSDHGHERHGAPRRTFNRFSETKIRTHASVLEPDVIIITDPTLIGSRDLIAGAGEDTIFIVNTDRSPAETKRALGLDGHILYTVPASKISHRLFKKDIPHLAIMGAFAKACPNIILLESLLKESKYIFPHLLSEYLVNKNIEAIKHGYIEAIRRGYDEVQAA